MTLDETKLLPCPFCGGEAELHEETNHISFIKCKNGCCKTSYVQDPKTAMNIWNTRKPMERIIERLEQNGITMSTKKKIPHQYFKAISVKRAVKIVKEGMYAEAK